MLCIRSLLLCVGVRVLAAPRSPGATMASCPSLCPPVGAGWAPGGLPPSWGCGSAGGVCAHRRSLCLWDGHLQPGAGSLASGSLSIAPAQGLDVARSSECALFYVEMSPILASGGAAFLLLLGRGTQPSPASAAHLVCVVLLQHKPEAPCSSPLLCQGPPPGASGAGACRRPPGAPRVPRVQWGAADLRPVILTFLSRCC